MKPLSVEEIKSIIADEFCLDREKALILAWAHERAEKNNMSWLTLHRDHDVTRECLGCDSEDDPRHNWKPIHWINEVLDEIGWMED